MVIGQTQKNKKGYPNNTQIGVLTPCSAMIVVLSWG